jgi:hypothetical protein
VASKSPARETYYANKDGSHTLQLSQGPVNYQDGSGNWQPISTALAAGPGGRLQEQANSVGVSLAPSSAGAPAAQTQTAPSSSASGLRSRVGPLAAVEDPHRLRPARELIAARSLAQQPGQLGDVRFLDPAGWVLRSGGSGRRRFRAGRPA